jgi:branched-subunit amino acid transport protein
VLTWWAVLLSGAAAYACRLLPLLGADRVRLGPRAAAGLRHAGVGALTALVVLAVLPAGAAGPPLPLLAGVAVGALLALRGWSMVWLVLAGGAVVLAAGAVM